MSAPEVQVSYSCRGAGVAVAVYEYVGFSLLGPPRPALMTFMRDGDALRVAYGAPAANLDGGHYAEAWRSLDELLYEDSPDDGTIGEMLEDEHPGLLTAVREALDHDHTEAA